MMIAGGLSSSRIFSRVSRPSTRGSQISSRTMSNAALRTRSRQASPLSTEEVAYPSSASMPARESRMPASSSTTRILCMLSGRCGRRGLADYRKFYDETCSHRTILLYPDGAMMIFDDTAHNGQAQAGAALLGGEIRQEEVLF